MTALDHPPTTAAADPRAAAVAARPDRNGRRPQPWSVNLSISDAVAALGLAGLVVFSICYSYERAFYGTFSLDPEAAGQGYTQILAKATTGGLAILTLLATALAGPVLTATWGPLRPPSRAPRVVWQTVTAGAVSAVAAGTLFVVAGAPVSDAARVAGPLGALGAALALAGLTGRAGGATSRRACQRGVFAVIALVLLVAVLRAWDAGADDARRLLRTGDARAHASIWQFLLGVPTPAVTITWTQAGETRPRQAPARLLGVDGDTLTVYDLNDCLLRRLPAGAATTTSRIGAVGGDPSDLPICPR